MGWYSFLEKPSVYNTVGRILSLGNESVRNYLKANIKTDHDSEILDVGCGTGRYAEVFSGNFYGMDNNPEYIEYASKRHKGNFAVMDATDLKFDDNKFDLVFNVGVFHHLSDEQVIKTVKEMQRVAKPGGRVLIIDAVFPRKINFIGYILFKADRGKFTRNFEKLEGLLKEYKFYSSDKKIKGSYPYQLACFIFNK